MLLSIPNQMAKNIEFFCALCPNIVVKVSPPSFSNSNKRGSRTSYCLFLFLGSCSPLHRQTKRISYLHRVSPIDTALPLKMHSSYGSHYVDHLAADGTGLLRGQVTVVTLLQVDAHLVGGLHLKAVQTLAGLGNDVLLVHAVHTSLSHTAVLPPQNHFAFANLLCAPRKQIPKTNCDKTAHFWQQKTGVCRRRFALKWIRSCKMHGTGKNTRPLTYPIVSGYSLLDLREPNIFVCWSTHAKTTLSAH